MEFREVPRENGKKPIEDFLLNEIASSVAYKITEKFELYSKQTLGQLMRAEHIKLLQDRLYEVRMAIKGDAYRFLGTIIRGKIFLMVHVFKKKGDGRKTKEQYKIGKKRINDILKNNEFPRDQK